MSSQENKNGLGPSTEAVQAGDMEVQEKRQHDDVIVMPEDIRNLSDAEIASMKKKMVRKMDWVIM